MIFIVNCNQSSNKNLFFINSSFPVFAGKHLVTGYYESTIFVTGLNAIYYICEKLIILSVLAVFVAILIDFINYNSKNTVKKSKRSIVATGSMFGFFAVYYLVLQLGLGNSPFENTGIIIIGTGMILIGSILNIIGRLQLKGNWANHIKIYEHHTLIQHGIYKVLRHPLYASIMLMLFGGSVVYRNYLSALLTTFVFIPFMYYRARQEETLLQEEFTAYHEYKKRTGMFFPKLWR